MLQKKDIVVFDFDGTLSARDSSYEFIWYCYKHSIRPWVFLPVSLVCATYAFINFQSEWWREKTRMFITPKMVQDFAKKVTKKHKENRFGWAAEQVAKEKKAGNTVILISASPDYLIPELVKDMKFDVVLCSVTEKSKPWKYKFLCWGKNKVVALDNWAKENKIIPNVVRSYSDSKSDMPIMKIAKERVWIDKKTGLRK